MTETDMSDWLCERVESGLPADADMGPDGEAPGEGRETRALALGLHRHGIPAGSAGNDRGGTARHHRTRVCRHAERPGCPAAPGLRRGSPARTAPGRARPDPRRRRHLDMGARHRPLQGRHPARRPPPRPGTPLDARRRSARQGRCRSGSG